MLKEVFAWSEDFLLTAQKPNGSRLMYGTQWAIEAEIPRKKTDSSFGRNDWRGL
jgi:hypothetical protein